MVGCLLKKIVDDHIMLAPYSEKLSWENIHKLVENKIIAEKTYTDCPLGLPKDARRPNFMEKTFANSHKFTKVSPLKISL